MANDITSHFYASLGLPLQERVAELTRVIDQENPFKDLQALFPQLVDNVFGVGSTVGAGWGLRTITQETNPYGFDALHRFLSPQGPMFRLCYKLLAYPQLKYYFPLNFLPLDIQQMLERGRCPQFYADLVNVDAHTISLSLNPFDYYMFHFATHLNWNVKKFTSESSSAYISLACDYLTHFLPSDPNLPVTPRIPYYTGKAPLVAPLQTSNRQLHSPSLLLIQEPPGLEQHSAPSTQSQSRNEIWRTETVIQVFIDVWLSIDATNSSPLDMQSCPLPSARGERVKVARILVKQIHAFSSKYAGDPIPRSSALRKCARQTVCLRVYKFVTFLVATWPLDASFRLVLELWLSSIQPWRYTGSQIHDRSADRYGAQKRRDDKINKLVDPSYTQFIAENLPAYTTIFQLMVPRFLRLDLTVPKNAVMVFRLAKVFAQPNLVPILREIEMAAMGHNIGMHHTTDVNWNMSYNYSMQDMPMTNKWGAIAKQAIAELNPSSSTSYRPMWGEPSRGLVFELMKKMANAKLVSAKTVADIERKLQHENQGFWSMFNFWSGNNEDDFLLDDRKMVSTYLTTAIQYFSDVFGFDSSLVIAEESPQEPHHADNSSFMSTSHFPNVPTQLRSNSINVRYMGDPELTPICSYECTVLIRILYQLSTRLNQMYRREMEEAWQRQDMWGYAAREVLQSPRTIHTYTKDGGIISENLGPRISLRPFASHKFLVWLAVGYAIFYFCDYGGFAYVVTLTFACLSFVFCKAVLKKFWKKC